MSRTVRYQNPRSSRPGSSGTRTARVLRMMRGPGLRIRLTLAALAAGFIVLRLLGWGAQVQYNHAEILAAIRMTETSGLATPPDGDDGKAIGPFQIHEVYWIDAGLEGDYQDCRDVDYATRVIEAYMLRYVPSAWHRCDAEIIARTHNGGPYGRNKVATQRYWRRVSQWLRRLPRIPAPGDPSRSR